MGGKPSRESNSPSTRHVRRREFSQELSSRHEDIGVMGPLSSPVRPDPAVMGTRLELSCDSLPPSFSSFLTSFLEMSKSVSHLWIRFILVSIPVHHALISAPCHVWGNRKPSGSVPLLSAAESSLYLKVSCSPGFTPSAASIADIPKCLASW